MAFVVVYDACVLHPAPLRDLLVRVGETDLVRVRWTERILDECFRSIVRPQPETDRAAFEKRLERTRGLMNDAIRDVLVRDYEPLEFGLSLPDPDDVHVLAAAIRAGAQAIITFNLKDFPAASTERFGIEAKHPDDFITDLIHLDDGRTMARIIEDQARALRNPPRTVDDLLTTLEKAELKSSVELLRSSRG